MTYIIKPLRKPTEPEPLGGGATIVTQQTANRWGLMPPLSAISAVGIFLVALAYNTGRIAAPDAELVFWFGLVVLFIPIPWRLLSEGLARQERVVLLMVLGVTLYFVKVLQYPLHFAYYDEFIHWRTAQDIATSGYLFQPNPLLTISPLYPGLEIVAAAINDLTGLSLFASGILVIGAARLVFVLALYLFYERISHSGQVAAFGTVLYMTNPSFLLFDADFSYESLALPLAVFVLFALILRNSLPIGRRRALTLAIWFGLSAIVVTHHITSYGLVVFLFFWTAISFCLYRGRKDQAGPGKIAPLGLLLCIAWLICTNGKVLDYLIPHLDDTISQLSQILGGKRLPRQLFQNNSGMVIPLWERVWSLASVALILLGMPFGLFQIWRRYRANSAAIALGGGSLAYPVSQALRFTSAGAELGSRATEFMFLGVAFVLAIGTVKFCTSHSSRGWHVMIVVATVVILIGQVIVAYGQPWTRLPGPYLVSADQRSIEPQGITAAQWAGYYMGPGQIVATDRTNMLLMATYGNEWTGSFVAVASVETVFTSPDVGPDVEAILRLDKVQYIVVDHRLSTSLPYVSYFNLATDNAVQTTRPIDLEALTKFDAVQQVNRIFDSGDIVIYDVQAVNGT
jgi:hypothetical protein